MQGLPKNKQSKKEDKPWRKWSCSPWRNCSSSSPWNCGCSQRPESCIFLADDISTVSSAWPIGCWCIRSSSQSTACCLPSPQSPYSAGSTLQLVPAPSVLYEPHAPSCTTSAYPLAMLWGLHGVSHQPSNQPVLTLRLSDVTVVLPIIVA